MPLIKSQAQNIVYLAFNYSSNSGQTGDAGNHTLRLIRDGVESVPANLPTEVDSANCPGVYGLSLSASEMNANLIVICGSSSTANVNIIPLELTTN